MDFARPKRCRRQRTGREDRHSNFYEIPDNLADFGGGEQAITHELRATWLQLAPDVLAWKRIPSEGVVSHRSAAAVYGLGHLPADRHEFTLLVRRQSRRPDVRLHHRQVADGEWVSLRGLPVTRPSRIAADLLGDREDPESVAQIVADAIHGAFDFPGTFADAVAPHAAKFGLRRQDGIALLRWLLDLVGDPQASEWMEEAGAHVNGAAEPAGVPAVRDT